ncbi:hypothetical protein A6D98_06005 [Aliivibrio fischeri]|nr:hypothetical protein [Aliivibrio fischeri]MUJ22543.1 hypothetical protein [Aliivibrio fischeri]OCH05905.1 hypothetical protein A6E10_07515 [Aliivibrio fischeri]OCH27471.1 hypothetical protein A6E13_06910 [Aliivibrio fischeri]OCH62552.1 hypothetical protein A6D98_06005 [Aliivibrio fischeri]
MSKDKFLAKMAIAYMQNHGHAPTDNQLNDWSELYAVLERKGN